jgi:hypothetical protein
MNTKITAKDFFLHLGAIATFYASTIALIALLFEVINFAYPKVTEYYQYSFPSISLQVATLIVAFPLFLFLSWLMQKSYDSEPALRDAPIRKWLAYITLFVAGAVVAGDLVTVIYMFLDGQELTLGFLLKVLALGVVSAGIFLYYLREIRNQITPSERNLWRIIAVVFILASIVLGFMVIGSPASQRERRYDNERVSDLQNIQWQIVSYWQRKEALPATLAELEDSISGFKVPKDPRTDMPYVYRLTGQSARAFELCATFDEGTLSSRSSVQYPPTYPRGGMGESWEHTQGVQCFERTIDPELYPAIKPMRQ